MIAGRYPPAVRCAVAEHADDAGWYLAARHAAPGPPGQPGHLRADLSACDDLTAQNASVVVAPLPAGARPLVEAALIAARHPGARVAAVTEGDCCWMSVQAKQPGDRMFWRMRGGGDPAVYASLALGFAVLRARDEPGLGAAAYLDLLRPWVRVAIDGCPIQRLLTEPAQGPGPARPPTG